ncbi:MAG TPA: pentapeptide repeat-containing protein, partial [Pilimelia sp.]|nr:pentapeptide repeat-containing protein [Pilimelia sp.]
SETAPAELPRLRLADEETGGGDVQVFGPSPERHTGGHVRAQLLGAVDDARLQLDQHLRGVFRVAPGFSGGPAWRPDTGAVAGMVQAAATDADATDAYALGVPVLVAALHSAAPAAPRASPPTGPLTVVHLAAPRCAAGGAEAAGPLVADLVRLGERHELAPDLVTVAGDLVERATPADYEAAYAFLDAVAAGLGLGRDRVVVVPGDHDVNRKKCHAHFLSQEAEDEKPVPPYWPKWSPFAGFVGTFLGREFPRDEPWLLADFPDLNLCVAALNSTIAQSHLPGDDYGWLGDEQLRRFADQLAAAPRHDWLRLGLVHHRPTGGRPARAGLRDADRFADVLGPHLHAVLHGRAGARRLEPLAGHGVPVLGPLTGAPPARPRGYQVIRLTGQGSAGEGLAGQGPVREELAVWARRYDEDRQRWLGDTGVSDDGDDWVRRVPARWRGAPARFPAPPGGDAAAADSGEAAGDTVGLADRGLADRGLVDRGRADRGRADHTDADPPDLLARVAEVCRLRAPDASVNEVREPTGRAGYLRLTRNLAVDPGARAVTESYPVAVHQGTPDWSDIERFQAVDALFRSGGAAVGSKLVYDGPPVAAELRERARLRGIELLSFAEFQLGYDLRPYARRQAERLAADPVYPPALYVPQRYHAIGDDGGGGDLLTDVRGWLADPDGHFVLVLGEFGHGKTFLLHELARRMHAEGDPAVPVLVHLRDLEKTHQLDELVAAQLTRGGQRRIDLAMFRYLLENGRIALLFDGYDELALRVTYDRAAEHLRTIVEAAGGRAKVVLTSRDQYFLTDAQVTSALGAQIAVLAGRRIVRVDGFDENQVLSFLTRRLGDGAAAARRLGLLRDVRDLLGLSRNPRMLGFIAAIDEGRLLAARDSTGEMTAAALYRELIDQWLHQEEHRLSAGGGPPGPSAGRLWEAVRGLAVRLWATPGGQLGLADLAETADALAALAPPAEEAAASRDETTQILGSATLLVRDAEGNFRFVHRSVLEWLVADACAARLRAGEDHPAALDRPMSALMADFLIALAGSNRALRWATGVLARGSDGTAATDNAILVSRRLGATTEAAQLAGRDLRGRDLTGQNLRGADLAGADLREATLVGADLTGADLTGANLARARLLGARLVAAVLRGADLTGADLRAANLDRTDLDAAVLCSTTMSDGSINNR